MSLFSILGTGVTGLQAAQQALNVIGQNIANANTPGYSRQRVDLQAMQSNPKPGVYTGTQTILSGVDSRNVERMKSTFLQAAATSAVAKQSALQSQVTPLTDVQTLLGEPGGSGLQNTLDTFFQSWSNLANYPTAGSGSTTAGNLVIANGSAVASQLKTMSLGIASQWRDQRDVLTGVLQKANQAAAAIADLNGQIASGQVAQLNVNGLMDQRDQAVNVLASTVGGVAFTGAGGQISVAVGGVALVSGGFANTLSLTGGADLSVAATDPPTVMIGSIAATPQLGQAAGMLAALNTDMPGVSGQLDSIAGTLRDAVNTLSVGGYTTAGVAGTDFFAGTGAADLHVVSTSSDELAVSASAGAHDGSNAQKIADLSDDVTAASVLGGADGPSALWRSLTSGVGNQIQVLNTALAGQSAIVTSTQNAVDSDSGVSVDEELTNMLLYQRSYQASAKVIAVTDEMMQTLMGMVP